MIGSKNVLKNIIFMLAIIAALYGIYLLINEKKDYLVMGGIAIVTAFGGSFMAWLSKDKAEVRDEISKKATKDEFLMVNKKIDDHIIDNRETYKELFDLQKETNSTVKEILMRMPNERRTNKG